MPVVALIVYVASWKSIRKKELDMLVYIIFNVLLFSIADILSFNGIHNMPFFHLNSLFEAWFLSYYIIKKITGKKFSGTFWITGAVYTCFFIINVLFLEDIEVFNSNSAGVSSLLILFLSMYYLLSLSKSNEILYFQRLPSFWIVSGMLIYNAVSVLVLLSYKYFSYENMNHYADNIWFVLSAAIIVKFALISIGLLCHRKQQATHLPFLL